MHKIISFISCGIMLCLMSTTASAVSDNYDPGEWEFQFHLQVKDGVLHTNTEAKQSYEATLDPVNWIDPKTSDYKVVITGVKGNTLGTYGFNDPHSIVPALNKSVFDVITPMFANGKTALFYSKTNTKLFEISLAGTLFCNDDKFCDMDGGENFATCPNDCPKPPDTPDPVAPPTPVAPTPGNTVTPPPMPTPGATGGVPDTVIKGGTVSTNGNIPILPIVIGVGAILLAVLGLVYMRQRNAQE